ncbi:MAG: rhodanese-like domain-containing protein [Rhodoferax sp.]
MSASITPQTLHAQLAGPTPPLLLDVRRHSARQGNPAQIGNAPWHDPALWLDWKDQIGTARPVVLYCAHGHEIGQGLCATLRAMGVDARYLEGGLSAWQAAGLPTLPLMQKGIGT